MGYINAEFEAKLERCADEIRQLYGTDWGTLYANAKDIDTMYEHLMDMNGNTVEAELDEFLENIGEDVGDDMDDAELEAEAYRRWLYDESDGKWTLANRLNSLADDIEGMEVIDMEAENEAIWQGVLRG